VIVTNFAAGNNNCEGVLINRATAVSITNFVSISNGGVGVWLNGAISSQVSNGVLDPGTPSGSQNNNVAGILVTSTNASVITGICAPANSLSRASRNIILFKNIVEHNTGAGILVEADVHASIISGNTSTGNTGGDLIDANNFCGSDVWFDNASDPDLEFPCVP
jgi:hypothetical protein